MIGFRTVAISSILVAGINVANAQFVVTDTYRQVYTDANAGNDTYVQSIGPWSGNPQLSSPLASDDVSETQEAHATADATGAYDEPTGTFSFSAISSALQSNGAYAYGDALIDITFSTSTGGTLFLSGFADGVKGTDGSYYAAQIQDTSFDVLYDQGLQNPAGGPIVASLNLAPGSYVAVIEAWSYVVNDTSNSGQVNMQGRFIAAPEPSSMLAVGLGLGSILLRKRRRA